MLVKQKLTIFENNKTWIEHLQSVNQSFKHAKKQRNDCQEKNKTIAILKWFWNDRYNDISRQGLKNNYCKYAVIVTKVHIFVTLHWTAQLDWEYVNYSSNTLTFLMWCWAVFNFYIILTHIINFTYLRILLGLLLKEYFLQKMIYKQKILFMCR